MASRPNYYYVLGLEPIIYDQDAIENAILAKKRLWNGYRGGTASLKQQNEAERFSLLIPEMRAFLSKPENVHKELAAFKKIQADSRDKNEKLLNELVETIPNKVLAPALVKKLRQACNKHFSEEQIESFLAKKGFKQATQGSGAAVEPPEQLEASVANLINSQLKSVNYKHLYEFLTTESDRNFSIRSSAKSLYQQAEEIYKRLHATGKTDPETTTKKALTGQAQSVFKNECEKRKYDGIVAVQTLAKLTPFIEVAGVDGFIDSVELDNILLKAKSLDITREVALSHIHKMADKRKWIIQANKDENKRSTLTCGFCNHIATSPDDRHCHHCGKSLIIPCPNCNHLTPTEQVACNQCGFHIGDAPLVQSLLDEAVAMRNGKQLDKAQNLIARALHYWPDWSAATKLKTEIAEQQAQTTRLEIEVQSLVGEKKLETALVKIQQSSGHNRSNLIETLANDIPQQINKANHRFEHGQRLAKQGNNEAAFAEFENALLLCSDHSGAIKAMADNPPASPTSLNSQNIGSGFQLTWQSPATKGRLQFKVIKKYGGVPHSVEDGELVAKTTQNRADDINVKGGKAFYYAVFTVRGETASLKPVVSGPHIRLDEVLAVTAKASDRQILLNWQNPEHCQDIEIWRKPHPQHPTRGNGVKIFSCSRQIQSDPCFQDSGLSNGQTYQYLIISGYNHPTDNNKRLYSQGVRVASTPIKPASAVNDLVAKKQQNYIHLIWTPTPSSVRLEIRQSNSAPQFNPGQTISVKEAQSCGKLISTPASGKTSVPIEQQGKLYFTPLTIIGDAITYGMSAEITTLDDIQNLTATRQSKSITLTWDWPPGAEQVRLLYRHDQHPISAKDAHASRVELSYLEYKHQGHFRLKQAELKKHFFAVYVHDKIANIFSGGVNTIEAMGQEDTVRYCVVTDKGWFKKTVKQAWVELQYQSGKQLEDVLVVKKSKFPPLHKSDGIQIHHCEKIRFEQNRVRIAIPAEHISANHYIKLFFVDDSNAKETRLLPAAQENLRIG